MKAKLVAYRCVMFGNIFHYKNVVLFELGIKLS